MNTKNRESDSRAGGLFGWRRRHRPEKNPFANPAVPCPLDEHQVRQLATYNSQRAEGLIHTEEWKDKMRRLQQMYDDWTQACVYASGGEIYRPGERPLHTE